MIANEDFLTLLDLYEDYTRLVKENFEYLQQQSMAALKSVEHSKAVNTDTKFAMGIVVENNLYSTSVNERISQHTKRISALRKKLVR